LYSKKTKTKKFADIIIFFQNFTKIKNFKYEFLKFGSFLGVIGPTKNLGPIDSAVYWKQTNRVIIKILVKSFWLI